MCCTRVAKSPLNLLATCAAFESATISRCRTVEANTFQTLCHWTGMQDRATSKPQAAYLAWAHRKTDASSQTSCRASIRQPTALLPCHHWKSTSGKVVHSTSCYQCNIKQGPPCNCDQRSCTSWVTGPALSFWYQQHPPDNHITTLKW